MKYCCWHGILLSCICIPLQGHSIGHMMTGSGGGGGGEAVQQQAEPQGYAPQQQQNPCAEQLQQFMECANNQRDLQMCEGFSFALKDCRQKYGGFSQFSGVVSIPG